MLEPAVLMEVGVGLIVAFGVMFVLVVLVMGVRMFVSHRFMSVLVLMMFGEM